MENKREMELIEQQLAEIDVRVCVCVCVKEKEVSL